MLEPPQPPGGKPIGDDPTVVMKRIIAQAIDLVPSAGALTTQDEPAC